MFGFDIGRKGLPQEPAKKITGRRFHSSVSAPVAAPHPAGWSAARATPTSSSSLHRSANRQTAPSGTLKVHRWAPAGLFKAATFTAVLRFSVLLRKIETPGTPGIEKSE